MIQGVDCHAWKPAVRLLAGCSCSTQEPPSVTATCPCTALVQGSKVQLMICSFDHNKSCHCSFMLAAAAQPYCNCRHATLRHLRVCLACKHTVKGRCNPQYRSVLSCRYLMEGMDCHMHGLCNPRGSLRCSSGLQQVLYWQIVPLLQP